MVKTTGAKSITNNIKQIERNARDKSGLDWNEAFRIINKVRDEIRDNFPYKVIHVEECENADDIIGTLCKNTQEFGQYEDVMIVSARQRLLTTAEIQ